ncbi:beta-eliminating lyase-related protein [Streptomyces sp. NPDC089799]|uniref:threonine aldolase family protein n=1 Tax=Streptomyces sp. NPDC089799 TaxID=3155066 RepID=UPI0034360D2E
MSDEDTNAGGTDAGGTNGQDTDATGGDARGGDAAGSDGQDAAAAGTDDGGADRQERWTAAWRKAPRALSRSPREPGIGELLEHLAGLDHDPDRPVDLYGDGVVADLERRVAELLGTEDAAFFPTGTMAQQVALRCWAGRTGNPLVALHPLSHPEMWEGGALSAVSGLRTTHPTRERRQPSAEEVRDLPEPFGTLMVELPLRDAGFVLPSWEELEELVEAAREREAVVHFDGARLWETTVHFGRPLPEIAALADSVYVSLYKSLGGLSGAALAGPRGFVEETRVWRHRYGGQVVQQFPQALSALAGLDRELPRLPSYVAQARVVAEALAAGLAEEGVPWFAVHPEVPHTHQFQVWLPYDADVLTEASVRQAEETGTALFRVWSPEGPPGLAMTEVTVTGPGLSWTADDVAAAVADFVSRVGA